MRWTWTAAIVVLVACACIVVSVILHNARKRAPALVITIDWEIGNDSDYDCPQHAFGGPLLRGRRRPGSGHAAVIEATKQIEGRAYKGGRVYLRADADDGGNESLVCEVFLRRLFELGPRIDIHISTNVSCALEFENFRLGSVWDLVAERGIRPPHVLAPGDYHLRADVYGQGYPVVVVIDCDSQNDPWRNIPRVSLSSKLMAHVSGTPHIPSVSTSCERQIGGLEYRGMAIYSGRELGQLDLQEVDLEQEAAHLCAFDIVVRRLAKPQPLIDVYLTCKEQCLVGFDHFERILLRHATTKKPLTRPYLLDPGAYHLEAVILGPPDEE